MTDQTSNPNGANAPKPPRKSKGEKALRPCPSISSHRTPSLYAELMGYPESARSGRLIELANFGLECMRRGPLMNAPLQTTEPLSAKPIEAVPSHQAPVVDASLIGDIGF